MTEGHGETIRIPFLLRNLREIGKPDSTKGLILVHRSIDVR